MRQRALGISASLLGLALIVWFLWPDHKETAELSSEPTRVGESATASPGEAVPNQARPELAFQTRLLPHGTHPARADSVRIGIATIPPDQARTYDRWVEGGAEGAGPTNRRDLAEIDRWLSPPASRKDTHVLVGPLTLPPADRYDLEAAGEHPLQFYQASFDASQVPVEVAPRLAAGLRVFRDGPTSSSAGVLLRRVENAPTDPASEALLRRWARELASAFDETPWPFTRMAELSPLPAGPVDVVLQINGLEAERRRIVLVAGQWTELRFDGVSEAVAAAVSTELELSLVIAGSSTPVDDVRVTWFAETGDQTQSSDRLGQIQFTGVDRQRSHRLMLEFPKTDHPLPIWPQMLPVELTPDDQEAASDEVWRETLELQPLRWLILRTQEVRLPVHRQGGNPYPIFVLQQRAHVEWRDVAADHFVPVSEGVAVSVAAQGIHRIVALRSPWSIAYSSPVRIRGDSSVRHVAELIPASSQQVTLTLRADGIPLANAPVAIRGPVRSLPFSTVESNARGEVVLEAVTVSELSVEVAGFVAAMVSISSATLDVELKPDPEASVELGPSRGEGS